ncbi:MAG: tRNA dihydrouridine(20/20a) synthase DusA, partial [Pseudomonadota bacterium]
MMDCTDRHYRYMMRFLTRETLLYTEMVTTGAIIFGDKKRHLDFSPEELPLSLQLGGDDPEAMAQCAELAQQWGYTEVNINVGCPSDRVKNGQFGASLMARPKRVADCVTAMKKVVDIPVTVKHRIGIDDLDKYEDMKNFVSVVSQTGADRFSVHARKAWLSGLSPKQNRNIPPLRYEEVYRLKEEMPELEIEINGGIRSFADTETHL